MSAEGEVPEWDDAFLDRVADRLAPNYDLEKEFRIRGERFDLYGELTIHSQKHFLHPSISFAHHDSTEHLFARRVETVRQEDLDRLVELGHALAEEWIAPSEEHYSTDFTFALVADDLEEGVREYVSGFSDRTLLKFGYHGHYEVNLLVVAPDEEALVASENADVAAAFSPWEPIEREKPGLLGRIVRRFG
ncbi:hypothetical protein [Halalkalicoccus sp. NIPERK01]|uniref:hypothetical protein n=1 Tax=Halalkalicoccus sp. NIPERK01 TaxID=3053469 RepID=UPI00256EE70B|nr:hypothetical protein [Halalkalicoccus sp. NIPERK01]MDL5362990.1 hypothetical protein [Halalkalicoccus sp. NIPERK01]